MRRFVLLLVLLHAWGMVMSQRTLKIMKLDTHSIKIGSSVCSEGSTFKEGETIYWSAPKQGFWAKSISNNSHELLHFSREAFVSRGAKSVKEYFEKINHPSTMGTMTLAESKKKTSFPEKRIAMVIGNSNYEYEATLNNPINNATDISAILGQLGFDVFTLYDVNYRDFDAALKKFCGTANGYDVALLYYCGHGVQYEGKSYLIPINANVISPDNLYDCIDMGDIYSRMRGLKCATKLLFVDACRTEKEWMGKETDPQDPDGIGVLFSTASNAFAFDGDDRNSPFAKAILELIDKPSDNYMSTINRITASVENATNEKQKPHYMGYPGFTFTFVDASTGDSSGELIISDQEKLEALAEKGDTRAYIPLAQFHLKNASGIASYEQAHIYALKAYNSNIDIGKAKEIFEKLELLDFYRISDYKKPY